MREPGWLILQSRYYDLNVWTEANRIVLEQARRRYLQPFPLLTRARKTWRYSIGLVRK